MGTCLMIKNTLIWGIKKQKYAAFVEKMNSMEQPSRSWLTHFLKALAIDALQRIMNVINAMKNSEKL